VLRAANLVIVRAHVRHGLELIGRRGRSILCGYDFVCSSAGPAMHL
jgi:hypothetical protein